MKVPNTREELLETFILSTCFYHGFALEIDESNIGEKQREIKRGFIFIISNYTTFN